MKAGLTSVDIEAPLQYRPADNGVGKVKATLEAHATDTTLYSITTTPAGQSATATINNNNKPYITIAPHSSSASGVTEADDVVAKFTISSTLPIPTGTSVTVGYTISESHAFIKTPYTANGTVDLDPSNQTRDFDVPIDSDTTDEVNGSITITLKSDSSGSNTYYIPTLAAEQKASVNVMDDDVPEISVAVHESAEPYVIETNGGSVRFTITASIAHYEDLTIEFAVTELMSTTYLPTTNVPENVVLPANMTSVHVDVPISYDEVADGGDGQFKLTLENHATDTTKYDITSTPAEQSATAEIRNDDGIPIVSVAPHTDSVNGVTEADNVMVKFTISAIGAIDPSVTISVSYTVTESHAFLKATNTLSDSVEFNSTTSSQDITLEIDNDDADEANGMVTLTITEDSNDPITYDLSTRSADVSITDDDIPAISIAVHADSTPHVLEDRDAKVKFAISSSIAPYEDITIEFAITNNQGTYLHGTQTSPIPENVVLAAGTRSVSVEAPLQYRPAENGVGKVLATLEAHASDTAVYELTSVMVNRTAIATINNNPKPYITIAPHSTSASGVTEAVGAIAKFTIEATLPIPTGTSVTVGYTISESHKFIETPYTANGTVVLDPENQSRDVDITIDSDLVDEVDGTITVTLQSDSSGSNTYYIPEMVANQKATVNVKDDDVPTMSVAVHDNSKPYVIETDGGMVRFTITSTIAHYEDLTIEFAVTAPMGDYLPTTYVTENVVLPTGMTSVDVEVPIKYTAANEIDGTIKLTLEDHATDTSKYDVSVSPTNEAATATIRNNSGIPVISVDVVSPPANGFTEGTHSSVTFSITSTGAITPGTPLLIPYSVSESHAFLASTNTLSGNATLNSTTASLNFELTIEDDDKDEANGTITFAITADSKAQPTYAVQTPSLVVDVNDDDVPALSIAVHTESTPNVTESPGAVAKFTITASPAPYENITIEFDVTTTGDYLPATGVPLNIELVKDTTSINVEVPVKYDKANLPDGTITVTLESHATDTSKYSIPTLPAEQSVQVDIINNTLPQITIAPHADSEDGVAEAEDAVAKLRFLQTSRYLQVLL